jgi:NAD(P)-dependent dehydrogenase (short-subunit alcohol dehydrogenase family)
MEKRMAANLEGKSILVTGVSGAGQIGYAIAEELAARGARLAIVARKQVKVEERAAELRSTGAHVLAITGDLTRETDVHNAVDIVVRDYGRIDVLINLAGGLTRYKPAIEHSLEDWTEELGNNLLSSFLCSREALVRMRESGGGVIINFARAGLPQANMVAY